MSFSTPSFIKNLNTKLQKHFQAGDEKNKYLRSANFDYRNFIDCENLKINYLLSQDELINYKNFINKKFYLWMTTKTK